MRVKRVDELLVLEVLFSELAEDGVEVEFEASNGVLELEVVENFWVEDTHVSDGAAVQDDGSSTSRHPSRIGVVSNKLEVLYLVFALLKLMSVLETDRASLLHNLLDHSLDHFKVSTLIKDHAANLANVTSSSLTTRLEDTAVTDLEHFLRNRLLLVFLKSHEKSRNHRSTDNLIF